MIGPSGVVRVLLATRPVDFRKGADGLAVLVRDALANFFRELCGDLGDEVGQAAR